MRLGLCHFYCEDSKRNSTGLYTIIWRKALMALVFEVKVIPSSGKTKWILDKNGQLKCYLKNPPEKGKANKELIEFIAESLACSKHDIEILQGLTARKKTIKVNIAADYEQFLSKIGLRHEVQGALF